MFDRTAHLPQSVGQKVWDFDTGLKVAGACSAAGRLSITGGEGYLGVDAFQKCLLHRAYDILQPEGRGSGGILTCRKVAFMAEGYHVPCMFHGDAHAGWLQATFAIASEWQDVALIAPPLLPQKPASAAHERNVPESKTVRFRLRGTLRRALLTA